MLTPTFKEFPLNFKYAKSAGFVEVVIGEFMRVTFMNGSAVKIKPLPPLTICAPTKYLTVSSPNKLSVIPPSASLRELDALSELVLRPCSDLCCEVSLLWDKFAGNERNAVSS